MWFQKVSYLRISILFSRLRKDSLALPSSTSIWKLGRLMLLLLLLYKSTESTMILLVQFANKTLNTFHISMNSMINKKIEDVVKVSTRGQIVIPKEIRKRMGVSAGERLLVMSEDRGILIKKLESLSMEEIGERIEAT